MTQKVTLTVLLFMAISFLLCGCWDRKELNQLGIVMSIGLDRDHETGKILLTSQVVRPASLGKQSSGGKEPPYDIVITSGTTVFEAVRNTVKEFDRRSFFSHVKVIVVGEDLAREGLNELIDFVTRTHEIRKFTWLIVTHDTEARNVLGVKHGIESVQATYMQGIVQRQSATADVTTSSVIDFIKKIQGEGVNPITGVFKILNVNSIPSEGTEPEPRKGVALTGTAAFKKDKLVGFLNEEETLGLNIITGAKNHAAVHVPSLLDDKKNISIEIKKADSTVKPLLENGNISFNIKVKTEGNVTEVQENIDISEPEQFDKVNEKFKELICDNVNITLNKVQKDLETDILGFGSAFERSFPNEWAEIKDQWDTLFPKVTYRLEVETSLRKTGLLLKPLNAKKADK